jgi:hypothetical protein
MYHNGWLSMPVLIVSVNLRREGNKRGISQKENWLLAIQGRIETTLVTLGLLLANHLPFQQVVKFNEELDIQETAGYFGL